MDTGFAIIIIIIILIVIGIIIWLIISINDNKTSPNTIPNLGNLDNLCDLDSNCKSAYTCQNGLCKAKIGSFCLNVKDCINTATACTKDTRVCTNSPLSNEGQSCSSIPCSKGLTCNNNICISNNISATTSIANLNQSCSIDKPCGTGMVCDINSGNLCKLPSASNCKNISDCINGNRCGFQFDADGNEIGNQICIPLIHDFKHCVVDEQCSSGRCGASSVLAYIPNDIRLLEANILDSYYNDGRLIPVQRFPDQSLLDVISEGRNLLMLLEDGTIIREVNNPRGSNFLETIYSNKIMQRLTSLGGITTGGPQTSNIYGLSDNILYELDNKRSNGNTWFWRRVVWSPINITHISRSHNGNFIWIQYRLLGNSGHPAYHRNKHYKYKHHNKWKYHGHHYYPYNNDSSDNDLSDSDSSDGAYDYLDEYSIRDAVKSSVQFSSHLDIYDKMGCDPGIIPIQWGALYQYTGKNSIPELVQRTIIANNIQRIYGLNNLAYLEVDIDNHQAVRYPLGDTISNFYVGVLLSDGSVFKLGIEYIERVRSAIYARGLAHVITFRLCRPSILTNKQIIEQAITEISNINAYDTYDYYDLHSEDILVDSRDIQYSIIKTTN